MKPPAYVRYGDDFLVFCPTRRNAHQVRDLAEGFLSTNLSLTINPKNDVVVSAHDGLKFLGHNITLDSVAVDKHTTKSILSKINLAECCQLQIPYAHWIREKEPKLDYYKNILAFSKNTV